MKSVLLVRGASTEQGTPGTLSFGSEILRTLELPWKDNTSRISCIPTGIYKAIWARSPSKGMCYHLLDVPGRGNILIHSANFAGGAGWFTQLLGCIAPANRIGLMRNPDGLMQLAGLVSRPATNKLAAWGATDSIQLEIK